MDLLSLIWQWVLAVARHWVWIMTSTIVAAVFAIVSAVRHEPIPWRVISWIIAGALVVAFFLAWRSERIAFVKVRADLKETQTTLQTERDTRGTIDLIHPWIRYAYGLENYDGSSEEAGNRDRVITRSSPPVRLHYSLYSEKHPVGFVFGVRNDNKTAPLKGGLLTVYFLDAGIRVLSHGSWASNLENYEYATGLPIVLAQQEMNGDSLKILFPHPGKYTIRIVIQGYELGQVTYDLPVVLE